MPYSNKLQTANLLQVANNLQVTNSLEVTNELLAVSTLPAPATPTFAISDGTTHTIQTVTITADGGTTTYYTTDGSTPTPASTLYSGPFNITVAETIKAYSVEAGHFDSAVGTVAYAQVTTPTFSPVAGTYSGTQSVTIISAGASNFYYKIGGPPSYGDETTGASVSVASSETVYARACRAGYVNSAIGSAAYVIQIYTLPTPGLGATNANANNNNGLTLNINVGDCVVIFVNTNSGTAPTITDDGSTSNTYVQVGTKIVNYGTEYCFVCLSAGYTATTVTQSGAGFLFSISGATYVGVGSIGAISDTTTGSTSPISNAVITTTPNSVVISGFQGQGGFASTWSATAGSTIASSIYGTVNTVLVAYSQTTANTLTTNSGTYSGSYLWEAITAELQGTHP